MSLTRRRSPTIQLAHHSVKEYLLSTRLSNPLFKLELLSASRLLGKTCLDYALHVVQALSITTMKTHLFRQFPLLKYICGCGAYHLAERHDRVLLHHLAVTFFWNTRCIHRFGFENLEFFQASHVLSCSPTLPCGQCARLCGPKPAVFSPRFRDSLVSFNSLIIPGMGSCSYE